MTNWLSDDSSRPKKTMTTLRIDEDVLEWFKGQGAGYQTRMNSVLRHFMEYKRDGSVPSDILDTEQDDGAVVHQSKAPPKKQTRANLRKKKNNSRTRK